MRTIVVGAGVVGVTTAYYLAREGHEVTVVDRQLKVAQEASGGNAGLISPGHSFAWASPAAPMLLARSLLGAQTSIRVKPTLDPRLFAWGLRFLRECTSGRSRANTLVKFGLCRYSQDLLAELARTEDIDYQQVSGGVLYLHRDARELEAGVARTRLLRDQGLEVRAIDAAEVARLDPALASAGKIIAGAVHVPSDTTGNSEEFARQLALRCEGLGVEFRLGTGVTRLESDGARVTRVLTDAGELVADNVVLATGTGTPALSRGVGQKIAIYPAKGYSLTVPLRDPAKAPTLGGIDEVTLVAWSRMGDELRMSSTAEFNGYSRDFKPADFSNMLATGRELFPDAAQWEKARRRSDLRPMTPDGPPVIGRGRLANLYYNTGHGHMGWTMACGSGQILADLMSGRTPALDTHGMRVRW